VVTPALEVQGLAVSYGPVTVCRGVDLRLEAGAVGALTGTNGAGKSTILRALAGLAPSVGSVKLFGEEISGLSARQRARRGLILAAGGAGTFASLTVEESVAIGSWSQPAGAAAAVDDVLALFPGLALRRWQRCATLSAGEQQLVVLARALAGRPRVLLVDKLTLGLAGAVAESVAQVVAARAPVLLVDQSLRRALALAGWVWFLDRGEVRFSGPPAALGARRDLLQPELFG
jgi:branched-chain amino acid transport system ATP-binding protein